MSTTTAPRDDAPTFPARHGHPWSMEEYEQLVDEVLLGLDAEQIAHAHERGVPGIRQAALKLIPDDQRVMRDDAITTLGPLLRAGHDWRPLAARRRERQPTQIGSLETEVARWRKARTRADTRLLGAIAKARAERVDEAMIRTLVELDGSPLPPTPEGEPRAC